MTPTEEALRRYSEACKKPEDVFACLYDNVSGETVTTAVACLEECLGENLDNIASEVRDGLQGIASEVREGLKGIMVEIREGLDGVRLAIQKLQNEQ